MPDRTEPSDTAVMPSQHDESRCPRWCAGKHLHQPESEGFRHDGQPSVLHPLTPSGTGSHVDVFPSIVVDDEGQEQPPVVELRSGETWLRLTPLEAFSLADALGMAAQQLLSPVTPPRQAPDEPAPAAAHPEPPHTHRAAVADIRHPVWCTAVPDDAPFAGDQADSGTFYDRLAPAEEDGEHVGRQYRLDVGGMFTYSVTATQTALHSGGDYADRIRLSVQNHELVDADASADMSSSEARQVARMLERVAAEQESHRGVCRG